MKKYSSGSFIDAAVRVYGSEADTISSFPATIYADGENASALIKGNLQQTGTPTGAVPITPTECGELSNNLLNPQNLQDGYFSNLDFDLAATTSGYYKSFKIYLTAGTYTISTSNNTRIIRTIIDGQYSVVGLPVADSYTFTTTINGYVGLSIQMSENNVPWDNTTLLMFNVGSSALPYAPYGYVIPFESGDTTTNIYLGTTTTTRKIKKRVFTSDDTFSKGGNGSSAYFVINLGDSTGADCVCTHYINTPITASNTDIGASITSASQNLRIRPEGVSDMTVEQFHTWVAAQVTAGTPLTIWYVLAAESVGILNEPLRKIGDNVDSVSATVPTLATAESITVDTTLKPSAVQLTYTGWHTHDDKKRSGGAWT